MCGIAGMVNYDAPADQARVDRMRRALHHRGPDASALTPLGSACLAHTRLALVDLSGGQQPLASADGRYTLTYNGEVYNHRELKAELELDGRWRFSTGSDSEVVLAAYVVWGEAALARLNGMFAFFVWDAERQAGFAARDRLGVKPFVYAVERGGDGGDAFVFASEAKALVAGSGRRPRAHVESVLEYLVAPCFSGVEHSMFEGLEHLQPGHLLRVTRDGIAVERWWDFSLAPDGDESLVEILRECLAAAVSRALRADVPVGLYLSGGLDSTILAALTAREARPLAYSIAFEGQREFDYARSSMVVSDDEPFADLAARELGLERERCPVGRADLAGDLTRLAAINDALPAWEQELAQHHLARVASRRYKAILVGDAADETHWGYHFLLDDEATRGPAGIVRRHAGVPIRADRLTDPVAHFAAKYVSLIAAAGGRWETASDRRLATTYLIVKRWLARLLHNGDVHAMAFSLEARVPFADIELLAVAERVPPSLGLKGGVEKWALREAARGLVPEAIRVRRKSALPKDQAAQAIYQREARAALDDAPLVGAFVDVAAARALCDPARRLDERERAALFRVAALGRWAACYGVAA